MPTVYTPQITDAGLAAAMAQNALGLSLEITHVVVGAGSYTPTAAMTALVDPRHSGYATGTGSSGNQVTGSARILSAGYTGAQFDIGEIGFYAGDPTASGILVMVLSNPGDLYGSLGPSIRADIMLSVTLQLDGVPPGSITMVFDPNATLAAVLMQAHLAAENPHPQYDSIPIGTVLPLLSANPTKGFLALNGSLIQRADWPLLVAHATNQNLIVSEAQWATDSWTLFGAGDGVNTMRLPDFRGEAMRFWDQGRGVDVGRLLGSWQNFATARPRNTLAEALVDGGTKQALKGPGLSTLATAQANPSTIGFVRVSKAGNSVTVAGADNAGAGREMDIINAVDGDPETRPRSVALLAVIKAGGLTSVTAPAPDPTPVAPPTAPTPVPSPAPSPSSPLLPPVANFSANPLYVEADSPVSFTYVKDPADPEPTAFLWDFGDTFTSTARNPTHLFATWGQFYTITLTVSNAAGADTMTKTNYVYITNPQGA